MKSSKMTAIFYFRKGCVKHYLSYLSRNTKYYKTKFPHKTTEQIILMFSPTDSVIREDGLGVYLIKYSARTKSRIKASS